MDRSTNAFVIPVCAAIRMCRPANTCAYVTQGQAAKGFTEVDRSNTSSSLSTQHLSGLRQKERETPCWTKCASKAHICATKISCRVAIRDARSAYPNILLWESPCNSPPMHHTKPCEVIPPALCLQELHVLFVLKGVAIHPTRRISTHSPCRVATAASRTSV